ncbi:UPF0175 family protein [Nodosilinea sp. P-1105]|nr:UPF0175 family protein [Nodosilinea sp. P-1105]NMF86386.1 UPF0175 family protein [Nodosilinea sp. P-1105]
MKFCLSEQYCDNIQLTETDLRTELAILLWRGCANALFQQERITLGTASQIASLHQIEFQRLIASRGICIHYDIEELEQDLSSLRQEGW